MKIVVTGASGFIGNAVVTELKKRGQNCIPVMRNRTGVYPDSCIVESYEDTPEGDVLIHLAENATVGQVNQQAHDAEGKATQLLERLLRKKYKRIVYASTYLIYGDKKNSERFESDSVVTSDTYTRQKLKCENILSKSGIDFSCARLANVYGPGMSSSNVISDVMKQIPESGNVMVRNDAPIRDYVYISDVASGLVDMALGKQCGTYNLGSGQSISVRGLAEKILSVAGVNEARKIGSYSETTNKVSCIKINILKINKAFQWIPKVTLSEGIRQLFREYNGN